MHNVQFLESVSAKKLNGKERNPTGFVTSLVIHHAHPASHCLPLPSQLGALEEDLALMLLLNLPLRSGSDLR